MKKEDSLTTQKLNRNQEKRFKKNISTDQA